MEKLESVIFYTIDRAIRTYRQYAQAQLKKNGFTITIDQWLIIKCILENPAITQIEIAELVFKDNASVTRIINLLVKSKYIHRKISKTDRRRTVLTVTQLGIDTINAIDKLVKVNRSHALNGLTIEEANMAKKVMETITNNCKK